MERLFFLHGYLCNQKDHLLTNILPSETRLLLSLPTWIIFNQTACFSHMNLPLLPHPFPLLCVDSGKQELQESLEDWNGLFTRYGLYIATLASLHFIDTFDIHAG